MPTPIFLGLVSAGCFLGLAHMAVRTPARAFRRATGVMALVGWLLALVAPAAGIAVLAPVLFSRRLADQPVPARIPRDWTP